MDDNGNKNFDSFHDYKPILLSSAKTIFAHTPFCTKNMARSANFDMSGFLQRDEGRGEFCRKPGTDFNKNGACKMASFDCFDCWVMLQVKCKLGKARQDYIHPKKYTDTVSKLAVD